MGVVFPALIGAEQSLNGPSEHDTIQGLSALTENAFPTSHRRAKRVFYIEAFACQFLIEVGTQAGARLALH